MTVNFIPSPKTREHAIELVENGAIDAALEPYGSLAKNPKLRRLLKDHRREEADYFRRTQVIPVIHTLVLQEELVASSRGSQTACCRLSGKRAAWPKSI